MKDKFRIVVPEITTISSANVPDRDISVSTKTVLWRGMSPPDLATTEGLIEGQIYIRTQRRLDDSIESHPKSVQIGNELLVQKRCRLPLLGWKTVDLINIPL